VDAELEALKRERQAKGAPGQAPYIPKELPAASPAISSGQQVGEKAKA
jgi:hypothetical protein